MSFRCSDVSPSVVERADADRKHANDGRDPLRRPNGQGGENGAAGGGAVGGHLKSGPPGGWLGRTLAVRVPVPPEGGAGRHLGHHLPHDLVGRCGRRSLRGGKPDSCHRRHRHHKDFFHRGGKGEGKNPHPAGRGVNGFFYNLVLLAALRGSDLAFFCFVLFHSFMWKMLGRRTKSDFFTFSSKLLQLNICMLGWILFLRFGWTVGDLLINRSWVTLTCHSMSKTFFWSRAITHHGKMPTQFYILVDVLGFCQGTRQY